MNELVIPQSSKLSHVMISGATCLISERLAGCTSIQLMRLARLGQGTSHYVDAVEGDY